MSIVRNVSSVALLVLPLHAQVLVRASVPPGGGDCDAPSARATISADGLLVAFESSASNLVAGDNNGVEDVFVYDVLAGVMRLVSYDSAGFPASQLSVRPVLSADGRFVAFETWADGFDPNDTNGWIDVYVRELATGAIERVSVDSNGQQGNRESQHAALSADGRFVAFDSRAHLAPNDFNFNLSDVYVRDRQSGTTELVSVDSSGQQGAGLARNPALSGDGRYVAFESAASLDPRDTNGVMDVYVRDLATGTTTLVSWHPLAGIGDDASSAPSISADGRLVAFESDATNLSSAPDTNHVRDVFLWDAAGGVPERISAGPGGVQSDGWSQRAVLSADGGTVAYESYATNLVAGDLNGEPDVFTFSVASTVTRRASVDADGLEADGASSYPALTADGAQLAFTSLATNLFANDGNGAEDVFLRTAIPVYSAYCFGDASGTPCPCGNESPLGQGRGCLNSLGLGGRLVASGVASTSADTLVLQASGLPSSTGVYVQGSDVDNFGFGSPFGDGLLCLGGTLVRLRTKPSPGGASQYPEPGNAPISVLGGALAGQTRNYQLVYRNAAAFCTAATSNTTNGVQVTWTF